MQEPTTNSERSAFEWRQIILSALVTGALTFIAALAIFHYTSDKPKLVYESFPLSIFESETTELCIYNVRVANEGSKECEDVTCVFTFPTASTVLDTNIELSSNAIAYSVVGDSSTHRILYSFPLLNRQEGCTFSFLLASAVNDGIKIDLRGKGNVGQAKDVSKSEGSSQSETSELLKVIFIPIMAVMMMMMMMTAMMQSRNQRGGSMASLSVGVDYCDMGLYKELIAHLRHACYQRPGDSALHSNLGRAYANTGEFDLAESELGIGKKLASDVSDKCVNYYTWAQFYALKANKEKCIEMLRLGMGLSRTARKKCQEKASVDSEFSKLRDDPEFQSILLNKK